VAELSIFIIDTSGGSCVRLDAGKTTSAVEPTRTNWRRSNQGI